MKKIFLFVVTLMVAFGSRADVHFIEAESFACSSDGWKPIDLRSASAVRALHGAGGDRMAVAHHEVDIAEGGKHRVWVRYAYTRWRGPFDLKILAGDAVITNHTFDLEEKANVARGDCVLDSFVADLPKGKIRLELSKYENKNCSGYSRKVDCVLISDDLELKPDYRDYGPQTYARVTIGEGYSEDNPVYVHIFADHFRAPYYSHHYLARDGAARGLGPRNNLKMVSGEQTPWCNITSMLYQDSGALLKITMRHNYHARAERLRARFEFATEPEDLAIVRTMDVDAEPNGLTVIMPPNLITEENRARLGRDLDFATRTGAQADSFDWPAFGRKPSKYPFYASIRLGGISQEVIDREQRTLDYFGFDNGKRLNRHGSGTWRRIDDSYCNPDIQAITNAAAQRAAELTAEGRSADEIDFWMVMDEPSGQSLEFMAQDGAYQTAFKQWLKGKRITPRELLVDSWEDVRTVTMDESERLPALYYYSHRFRTRALGDFIAVQRRALEEACGARFPVNVNFSDGAVYRANFYGGGVDYFELLDESQNSIWGEDWANISSTYQCSAYNVDLMRAATRERGQIIGHYLIAYAGRKPLDIKLKAAGNVARGVKIMESFFYGPYWNSHEGGPSWRSSAWQNKPDVWRAHAELLREIGAAEDLLLDAMPRDAQVALLYSSASDIWTVERNHAYGFERMHTWLALTHAQIPVDIVSEDQVAKGMLKDYKVCYYSGPNLIREAAIRLEEWVRTGGILVATAGAGERDEYNRKIDTVERMMPAKRDEVVTIQTHMNAGRFLANKKPQGKAVMSADGTEMDILLVRQPMEPKAGARVVASDTDGKAVWVEGSYGRGRVHFLGFMPSIDYIHKALLARQLLVDQTKLEEVEAAIDGPDAGNEEIAGVTVSERDRERIKSSANPWDFSDAVREAIVFPVRQAEVTPPIICNVPLVDAVYMRSTRGIVIPLANYTLLPLPQIKLSVLVDKMPKVVESVHHGKLEFQIRNIMGKLYLDLEFPLESTDYLVLK